uniref:hypothetical protein n=1 Tax=Variovorax sp. S12S4 TaxID=3029170 RepID=UPI003159666D
MDNEKNVQEPGQFLHHPRGAPEVRRRKPALLPRSHALSQRAQLQRCASDRRPQLAQAPLHGAGPGYPRASRA